MDEIQKVYDDLKWQQDQNRQTLITIANANTWDILEFEEEDVKKLFARMKLRADKMFMLELIMGKLKGKEKDAGVQGS